jgi:hypothetical protein
LKLGRRSTRDTIETVATDPDEALAVEAWPDELALEAWHGGPRTPGGVAGLTAFDVESLTEEFSVRMEKSRSGFDPCAELTASSRIASPPWVPPPTFA